VIFRIAISGEQGPIVARTVVDAIAPSLPIRHANRKET